MRAPYTIILKSVSAAKYSVNDMSEILTAFAAIKTRRLL